MSRRDGAVSRHTRCWTRGPKTRGWQQGRKRSGMHGTGVRLQQPADSLLQQFLVFAVGVVQHFEAAARLLHHAVGCRDSGTQAGYKDIIRGSGWAAQSGK